MGPPDYTDPGAPVRFLTLVYTLAAASTIGVPPASTVLAQDIAARVARVPVGIGRIQFASRSGSCGDGRDAIGFRKIFFAENFQSMGNWSAPNCVPGPVRVALTVVGGQVTRIRKRAHVGAHFGHDRPGRLAIDPGNRDQSLNRIFVNRHAPLNLPL
jgi:hypothetical protein